MKIKMQQREINVRYAFGQKVWRVVESVNGTLNAIPDHVKSVELMHIDRHIKIIYRFVVYQCWEEEKHVFSTEKDAIKQIDKILKKRSKNENI
jgi:hypothetical protein